MTIRPTLLSIATGTRSSLVVGAGVAACARAGVARVTSSAAARNRCIMANPHSKGSMNRATGFHSYGQALIGPLMPTLELSNPAALPADWRDFLALTKPRVMSLVVFSGLCGLLVAPAQLPMVLGFTAILCIALGAGACGALNQWYESDLDAKMKRTAKRPLPAGRMDRQSALHFGVGLGAFSVLLMGLAANWLAALLLAASILFYVFIYTVWLKPRTAQNIVIGGAAGGAPPPLRSGCGPPRGVRPSPPL